MDTLENLLQSGQSTGPYPKALKVYIVQTKVQADVLNLGIADNTAAYKAVCYNKDVKTKLVKGNTVLLRDFHKGRSCLIINSKTKVINAPALSNLTKQILEHAQHLVDPPPPQLIALKDVQLPKPGTPTKLLTVSGEIVQDETSRSVASGQQVRNIKIAEDGTVRPVALWNNASTSPAKAGDKITLTHVIVKDDQYLKQLAISTTNQTIITIHAPQTLQVLSPIIGAELDDQENILFTVLHQDDLKQLTLPSEKKNLFLAGSTLENKLYSIGTTEYKFDVQGTTISDMKETPPATPPTKTKTMPAAKKTLKL